MKQISLGISICQQFRVKRYNPARMLETLTGKKNNRKGCELISLINDQKEFYCGSYFWKNDPELKKIKEFHKSMGVLD